MRAKLWIVAIFLSALLFYVPFGRANLTEADFVTYEDYKKFDFNTVSSPLASGYTNVTHLTLYSAGVLDGWNATLDSRDRSSGGALFRDFNFIGYPLAREFKVDVEASVYYQVTLYVADYSSPQYGLTYYVENALIYYISYLPPATPKTETFNVTVSDGVLNLKIYCDGNPYAVVINGLDVRKGVIDTDAWLQYQIDINQAETLDVTLGVVIVFALTFSFAFGLIFYARRRRDQGQEQQTF